MEIPGASGSPVAATAKAAHDVLVNRFPWQSASLDLTYNQYLADRFIPQNDPGVAVGATAAAGIIALRANDGSFPNPAPPPFLGGTAPGVWRPTLPLFAPMVAPWLGSVTPFVLTSPSQFLAHPPPALNSPEYTRAYNEAKRLGCNNCPERDGDQTDLAHFWNSNFVLLMNRLVGDIAGAHVTNISDSSRLFALADMSMADAIITAWNTKVHYVFWRPITAIQEGNNDGNPRTIGDTNWLPLINTPAYPDHTSGANNIIAAATRTLALIFGNQESFSITTTNLGPTIDDTRDYTRFSDVQEEVVNARIYQGIHFRFADEDARKQGRHIAQWAFSHFLKPLGDD
ncbi:MAG: vanadium-dependent haloperoxidase [Pyrinomonadaceae bacterium]|nr:vanadium-dependent haloperoxidase [Pyrinomonadaceae bacterium]